MAFFILIHGILLPCHVIKPDIFFFDRHKTKRNWLVELWIKYAYLSGRDPIAGKEENHTGEISKNVAH